MIITSISLLSSVLSLSSFAQAAPLSHLATLVDDRNSTRPGAIGKRQSAFSIQDVEATFLRPALFSRVAYCEVESVNQWACGGPCEALGDVEVLLSGGDGGEIPQFFVMHDKTANSIVVSHQGTERDNVVSIINNLKLDLVDPHPEFLAAATGKGIEVHEGFHDTFSRTAGSILSTVTSGLASTNATKVVLAGHSLGGAIATFDGIMLRAALPADIPVEVRTFGEPRTGNQEWADFVGTTLGASYSRLTNQNDPVPDLPPQFLDYRHSASEIHIKSADDQGQPTEVIQCSGQEDGDCSEGVGFFDIAVGDHAGPYFRDISFGRSQCPFQ